MGKFIGHEPCPECGSKDNLARYVDGSAWCFGCRHFIPATYENFNPRAEISLESDAGRNENLHGLLNNLPDTVFGEEAVWWLSGYGITMADAIRFGWKWDGRTRQLLFPLLDEWEDVVCIQAKNFDPERASKAKYFNRGDKSGHWARFISDTWWREDTVVVTEDIVSSAKVSKSGVDAYPLLGTSITKERLVALSRHYKQLFVWLDHDKYKEALDIKTTAQFLGMESHVILTEKDPKCYPIPEIREYIRSLHD